MEKGNNLHVLDSLFQSCLDSLKEKNTHRVSQSTLIPYRIIQGLQIGSIKNPKIGTVREIIRWVDNGCPYLEVSKYWTVKGKAIKDPCSIKYITEKKIEI